MVNNDIVDSPVTAVPHLMQSALMASVVFPIALISNAEEMAVVVLVVSAATSLRSVLTGTVSANLTAPGRSVESTVVMGNVGSAKTWRDVPMVSVLASLIPAVRNAAQRTRSATRGSAARRIVPTRTAVMMGVAEVVASAWSSQTHFALPTVSVATVSQIATEWSVVTTAVKALVGAVGGKMRASPGIAYANLPA